MAAAIVGSQSQQTIREKIREGAALDAAYMLMNALAATIASYGLLANSPAVVIGAMIVAMLLQPIAGVSLALADSELRLLVKSLSTLLAGTIGVMVTAFIIGTIHKDIPITSEIMARTAPNLLDFVIALAGGAAGAYATVSPRLSIAFVGVAIATALVPPLSSASILLAHGQFALARGALLLALTDMVAIQFAFSVVLWFSIFRRDTGTSRAPLVAFARRNAVSLCVLLALGVVLTTSLHRVVSRHLYETTTRLTLQRQIDASLGSYLVEVRFETIPATTLVRAVVRGSNPPSAAQVAAMEAKLPSPPDGTKVELRVRFVQTMVIGRDGPLYQDAAFGTSP